MKFSFSSLLKILLFLMAQIISSTYIVMIDAGSTGSRVYLYNWNIKNNLNDINSSFDIKLVQEANKNNTKKAAILKLEPGLSSYEPSNAFESIIPLIDYAASIIPLNEQKFTFIYVFATAGLRALDENISHDILSNIRQGLIQDGRFLYIDSNQVSIINGVNEGIYSWLSLKYTLYQNITKNNHIVDNTNLLLNTTFEETNTLIELGGGSLQYVNKMNPIMLNNNKNILSNTYDTSLSFYNLCNNNNNINDKLYVETFLGAGANSMWHQHLHILYNEAISLNIHKIDNPCLLVNQVEVIQNVTIYGTGNYNSCKQLIIINYY